MQLMDRPETNFKDSIVEYVPVEQILIDQRYQRPLSRQKVKAIADDFDPAVAGVLLLSLRDSGDLYVIDGQHRHAAMLKVGYTPAKCEIKAGLTLAEEARLYRLANTSRKNPEALDLFRARLVEGDPVAVAINAVIEKCKLAIQYDRTKGHHWGRKHRHTWAVGALEDIYKKGGSDLLEYLLTMAMEAWPDDYDALSRRVLEGLLEFHVKYEGKYDRKIFVQKMNMTTLPLLEGKARYHAENLHTAVHKQFCLVIQQAYDWHRRGKRLEPVPSDE